MKHYQPNFRLISFHFISLGFKFGLEENTLFKLLALPLDEVPTTVICHHRVRKELVISLRFELSLAVHIRKDLWWGILEKSPRVPIMDTVIKITIM